METSEQVGVPEKKFLVTVAALSVLQAADIEDAIRDCPWSRGGPFAFPSYNFEPSRFVTERRESRGGQAFRFATRDDGGQQLVLLPDEQDCPDNAFGPSPFSPQFQQFRETFALDYMGRGHADFNMVVIPATTVDVIGWAATRDCILRFVQGDFGDHQDPATALSDGGRYRVDGRLVQIARHDEDDLLKAVLLD